MFAVCWLLLIRYNWCLVCFSLLGLVLLDLCCCVVLLFEVVVVFDFL